MCLHFLCLCAPTTRKVNKVKKEVLKKKQGNFNASRKAKKYLELKTFRIV
jgi:hypothetical protein